MLRCVGARRARPPRRRADSERAGPALADGLLTSDNESNGVAQAVALLVVHDFWSILTWLLDRFCGSRF